MLYIHTYIYISYQAILARENPLNFNHLDTFEKSYLIHFFQLVSNFNEWFLLAFS